jgi:hypothetical protein
MRGMSVLAAAGLVLLATQSARAQAVPAAAEPAAATPPPAAYRPAGQVSEASAPAGATGQTSGGWSAQDVQLAQARCAVLLKGLDVVAVPEGPLREGSECGAPAPMRLLSVGKNPQVAFSPPPILTCDMIAQLHKWVQRDVQPLARKFMAAPIVRIETMSSYSCRNAYGRAHGRLSEHGRANAVDIGSFVTALGQAALVVSDWGPTAREVAAAAAAASKTAAQQANAAARTGKGGPENAAQAQPQAQPVVSVAPAAEPPGRAAAAAITGFSITIPGVSVEIGGGSNKSADSAFAPAQRLGGPKVKTAVERQAAADDARLDFLRAVHGAACRQFGTVLGPEANTWHKNHFHIDMADRPHGAICE